MPQLIKTTLLAIFLIVAQGSALADNPLFKHDAKLEFDAYEKQLVENLENERLFVIFEANISSNLSRFQKRWGENYNRSKLDNIKSLLICNPWYANQVSNEDPDMLAFCPLRINLVQKGESVSTLFIRPSQIFPESKAAGTLNELEETIIKVIQESGK